MTMKYRNHDEVMAELFRDDPQTAVEVLDAIVADGDQGELTIIRRQMANIPEISQTVCKEAKSGAASSSVVAEGE
jgi:DNA-binding phage protein